MLIKESQLMKPEPTFDMLAMLDEATYLSEEESKVNPITIPVREMTRFGEGHTMVRFSDVERLAEDSGVSYMDAVAAIAEASEVDVDKMTIAVDEATLIVEPSLLDEMTNIVVAPVSESSLAYKYVSECINAWADKESTAEVDAMLEAALVEDTELDAFCESIVGKVAGAVKNADDKVSNAVGGVVATAKDEFKAGKNFAKLDQEMEGKDQSLNLNKVKANIAGVQRMSGTLLKKAATATKEWIGQKIGVLRNIVAGWAEKAKSAPGNVASALKAAIEKVKEIIGKLMEKVKGNKTEAQPA